jgi:hypothetical protein
MITVQRWRDHQNAAATLPILTLSPSGGMLCLLYQDVARAIGNTNPLNGAEPVVLIAFWANCRVRDAMFTAQLRD